MLWLLPGEIPVTFSLLGAKLKLHRKGAVRLPNLFDYLTWRGDISLLQVPLTPVDNLILSNLSYVHFDDLLCPDLRRCKTLRQAAEAFLSLPPAQQRSRVRCKEDLDMLRAILAAPRFADLELAFYDDRFIPEEEMQFAAMAVLLGDGSAFLSFRGTDSSLVGWKEDFNMSFLDFVPAQQAALEYTERFADAFPGPLYLGGHSKGGNLAVFAASLCRPKVRDRIRAVFNNDGPGFTTHVLDSAGYQELLTRIQTFVPQSSVIGMLLEHEESYTVVKSRHIGIFQHDPYTWEVLGGDFVRVEEVTAGSRITDRAVKNWVAHLSAEERSTIVDSVYELFTTNDIDTTTELRQPRNILAALRSLKDTDGTTLRLFADAIGKLARSTADALRDETVENTADDSPYLTLK